MDKTGKKEMFSIYTFDSEDFPCSVGLPGTNCIGGNAISWFSEQQNLFSHGLSNRDLVFMHRPLQELMTACNVLEIYGLKGESINCQAMNTGLFAQILENGNTAWISSGGAADNDFFTIYHGIHMSTARKTGSAGAGNILRGARIFKMQQNKDASLLVMSS